MDSPLRLSANQATIEDLKQAVFVDLVEMGTSEDIVKYFEAVFEAYIGQQSASHVDSWVRTAERDSLARAGVLVADVRYDFERYLSDKGLDGYWRQYSSGIFPSTKMLFEQEKIFDDTTYDRLDPSIRADREMLQVEIHGRQEYASNQTVFGFILQGLNARCVQESQANLEDIDFWSNSVIPVHVKKADGSAYSALECRNLFRAGLTDYKSEFVARFEPQVRQVILLNLESVVDESDHPDEPEIDVRIVDQVDRVKWYLDQLGFPDEHQNVVFRLIFGMEGLYRDKLRKVEVSQFDDTKMAPSFSHLLRVLRIGLGLFDGVWKKGVLLDSPLREAFDDLFVDESKTQFNYDALLQYVFDLLGHDLEEDVKFTGLGDRVLTRQFFTSVVPKVYGVGRSERSLRRSLIETSAEHSHLLNTRTYNKDREAYLKAIGANYRLWRVKLADMLQNHSSPYVNHKPDKLEDYAEFMRPFYAAGLSKIVPDRLQISALAQNPIYPMVSDVWRDIKAQLIQTYDTSDMIALAREFKIPLARDFQLVDAVVTDDIF